jgi:hypothetical protein
MGKCGNATADRPRLMKLRNYQNQHVTNNARLRKPAGGPGGCTHNAGVEGSSPSLSTIKSITYLMLDTAPSQLKCRVSASDGNLRRGGPGLVDEIPAVWLADGDATLRLAAEKLSRRGVQFSRRWSVACTAQSLLKAARAAGYAVGHKVAHPSGIAGLVVNPAENLTNEVFGSPAP